VKKLRLKRIRASINNQVNLRNAPTPQGLFVGNKGDPPFRQDGHWTVEPFLLPVSRPQPRSNSGELGLLLR
jgi:hypothetical protein